MAKSVFTGAHAVLVEVLVEARRKSGLTQAELAARIGKDQTFISIVENSQRRVDVIEFFALAHALGEDPVTLFTEVAERMPQKFSI